MEFKLWPLGIGGRVGVCDFWGRGFISLGVGNWAEKRGKIRFTPKIVFLR